MNQVNQMAVVVTGASTGIGAACALDCAGRGMTVFAGVRDPRAGEALAAKGGPSLIPITLDVTDEPSIARSVEVVQRVVGEAGLRGLVNNAGIAIGSPLEVIALSQLRKQLEVNVIGQIAVTQAFLPLLRRGRGRIVNMGSIAGRGTIPLLGPYSASKFALEALTDALRMELQPWGDSGFDYRTGGDRDADLGEIRHVGKGPRSVGQRRGEGPLWRGGGSNS